MNTAMQQALEQAGITTAAEESPVHATPAEPTLRRVPTPKIEVPPLSVANLQSWYDAQRNIGRASGEGRAIKVLLGMVAAVDTDTLRKTLSEWTKTFAKGTNERKVVLTRTAEVKALYGANKFAPEKVPQDKGYHGTVTVCREVLAEMHLKYDGSALKDEARRKAEKVANVEASIEKKARIAYHDSINRGGTVKEAEAAEAAARAGYSAEVEQASAVKIAEGIWNRYGKDNGAEGIQYCERICNALLDFMQQTGSAPQGDGTEK